MGWSVSEKNPTPSLKIPAASFVTSLPKLMSRTYSVASIDPKFSFIGEENIPVSDILIEVVEFASGPFLPEDTEPQLR